MLNIDIQQPTLTTRRPRCACRNRIASKGERSGDGGRTTFAGYCETAFNRSWAIGLRENELRTQPWLLLVSFCLLSCALVAQVAPYGSVPRAGSAPLVAAPIDPELNGMLRQIEQLASSINLELGKLRG